MKTAERSQRIYDIVVRLSQLSELDRSVIQTPSSQPRTITLTELFAWGERYEEREQLHDELKKLASEALGDE
jgi:hypothetical protein